MNFQTKIREGNFHTAQIDLLVKILAHQQAHSKLLIEKMSLTDEKEAEAFAKFSEDVNSFALVICKDLSQQYGA